MRTGWFSWVGAVVVSLSAVTLSGCYWVLDLDKLTYDDGTGGTGGTGGTTTVTPGCIPSENDSPVDETCGVFVSVSLGKDVDEEGRGSKGKPWGTIAAALGAATGKPVYVCGETFTEAVEITAGARVYGALDCTKADWPYAAEKRTAIAPTVEGVALRVVSKAKLELYDVNVTSADAKTAGASSIAVFAEADTELTLTRSDVEAKSGAEGESPVPESTGTPGPMGENGADGCMGLGTLVGGAGGQNVCDPAAVDVSGGFGGNGTTLTQGGGGDPGNSPAGVSQGGAGGTKQIDGAPVTQCTAGGDGTAGMPGEPGDGATDAQLGALDESGFTGAAGSNGKSAGIPGAGGGGGGGAMKCMSLNAGPSGGGGGAGGCGGAAGKGGKGGGASIGLVSLGAKLTFASVTIKAGAGGKGGAGGMGQPGGAGGDGGTPGAGDGSAIACGGGKGGAGGPGGRGGGGRGGPSFGVAHTGAAPSLKDVTIMPGKAGEGGEGDGAAGQGKPGVSKPVQAFGS